MNNEDRFHRRMKTLLRNSNSAKIDWEKWNKSNTRNNNLFTTLLFQYKYSVHHICGSVDSISENDRLKRVDKKMETTARCAAECKNVDSKSTDSLIRFRCNYYVFNLNAMANANTNASIESGNGYYWNVSIRLDAFFNSISFRLQVIPMLVLARSQRAPVLYRNSCGNTNERNIFIENTCNRHSIFREPDFTFALCHSNISLYI